MYSRGTEVMAAWFSAIIASARPQPCSSWPMTKCGPMLSGVSPRLTKHAAAKHSMPPNTMMRTSTVSSIFGINGISRMVGRPASSST